MKTFKVICKASGNDWAKELRITKIVNSTRLFGLLKSSKVISEVDWVRGPVKEEVCIVLELFNQPNGVYYKLSGYPYGNYDSKYFIRLDEFTETQKEIAKKSEPALN